MDKNINQPDKPKLVFIGNKCIGELIEETEDSLIIKYNPCIKPFNKDEENLK